MSPSEVLGPLSIGYHPLLAWSPASPALSLGSPEEWGSLPLIKQVVISVCSPMGTVVTSLPLGALGSCRV